ncbi:hypothetical protein AAFC00_006307 [Neodothiora populina]|uniref:Chromo domain-containing protein n=1 Tax=Neodothiora populina TaxID=2781224 RepID=A0ABR3P664_9PEZI
MPPKRKRTNSGPPDTPRKKSKAPAKNSGELDRTRVSYTSSRDSISNHPHGQVDPDQLYKVRRILAEDRTRYKIDWENGPNGETYAPTWEPKENANDAAIEDWEATKIAKKRRRSSALGRKSLGQASDAVSQTPTSAPIEPDGRPKDRASVKVATGAGVSESPEPPSYESHGARIDTTKTPATPEAISESQVIDDSMDASEPLHEIQDSYSASHNREDHETHTVANDNEVSGNTSPDPLHIDHYVTTAPSASIEIRITPRVVGENSNVDWEVEDSTFFSSQVISGTQPNEEAPTEEYSLSLSLTDAAAAPDLTQKHSQFEPEKSLTSKDISSSVVVTSSSGVHTLSALQYTPYSAPAPTPDSQLNDSVTDMPLESSAAIRTDTGSSPLDTQYQPDSSSLQDVTMSNDQAGLESSVNQRVEPPDVDNALQESNTINRHEDLISSTYSEPSGVDQSGIAAYSGRGSTDLPAVNTSPIPVASCSTQTPIRSQSRGRSPSQGLQSQVSPGRFHSIEQAAQQVDIATQVETDSGPDRVASLVTSPPKSPLSNHEVVEKSRDPSFVTSDQATDVWEASSGTSVRFHTQIFPPALDVTINTATNSHAHSFTGPPIQDEPSQPGQGVTPSSTSDPARHQASSDEVARPGRSNSKTSIGFITNSERPFQGESTSAAVVRDEGTLPGSRDPALITSSPVPSAPSQYLSLIGESAPTLPRLPSASARVTPQPSPYTPRMSLTPDTASRGKAKLLERMSAARAANRSKAAAFISTPKPASAVPARLQSPALQDREIRSPSMIPAVEVITKETPEEYFRSERYETLLPGDGPDPQPLKSATMFEPAEEIPKETNGSSLRCIPINFGEQQRDHYKQTMTWRKELIDEFTSKVWPINSDRAHLAQKLLQELDHIVLHPDLVNEETYTQASQVLPEFQAQWDADTSTKFRFLKQFFAASQQYGLTVVLLVRPGRIVGMLQTFLRGINVDNRIASDLDNNSAGIRSTATILTTDNTAAHVDTPDMIIALQGNIPDAVISSTQTRLSQLSTMTVPAYLLVVPKSSEHIERTLPQYASEAERLHVLVGTVATLRSEAGRDREGNDSVDRAASSLIDYYLNPTEWPLDSLPEIHYMDMLTVSQAPTESRSGDSSEVSLDGHSRKRHNDSSEDSHGVKKAKGTHDASDVNDSQNLDDSHVSDSVASQQALMIKALKEEMSRRQKDMDAVLHRSQEQLQEHVKALATLQYDQEEQRGRIVNLVSERDNALAREQNATLRIVSLDTRFGSLREERNGLQDQLRIAKESLLSQAPPDQVEFEALKEAALTADAERTRLANKAKQADENLDYLREQYQTASNMASQLGKANASLEARVAELKKRVTGERIRARDKTLDKQTKAIMSTNRQLRLMLKSREEQLARKEDEISKLKENGRGRMNTRGSSVPRTPRLGSPLAQGTNSRQGSPAAGKGPHPLRNAG